MSRTGGKILVDQLVAQGVDTVFCVPGESFLAALDALHDAPLRVITCRHEAGAATMAEAYGKLTGRPGVCFVTRGPGATHASVGVHTAFQDSTPMLLLIGQVPRAHRGREAFQEVDFDAMFGPLAKHTGESTSAAGVVDDVAAAFEASLNGRPGPAVLALPEDVQVETATVDDAPRIIRRPGPTPDVDALARIRSSLADAKRPLVIVGGGGWSQQAGLDVAAWAEANHLPLVTTFRRQDYVDNRSDSYCGYSGVAIDPAVAAAIRDTDWLLALGARLDDPTTGGYTLLEAPTPEPFLVHIYADGSELGRVYEHDLGIVATSPVAAGALRALDPVDSGAWRGRTEGLRRSWLNGLDPAPVAGGLDLGAALRVLRERVGADTVITNGAGNFSVWPNRLYRFTQHGTQLAPTSGAMGYGLPAALAAKVVRPASTVVCFAGDGDFLMSGQELATAAQYDLQVIVIVVNNGMLGTIRMHQEREYPGRVVATTLENPDFTGLARAYGAHAELVEETADFAPALERALRAGTAALIEARVDPEALSLRASLTQVREQALARLDTVQ